MGAISTFYINDYPIFTESKDYYHEVVNLIFLTTDFIEFDRPSNERNKLVWGEAYNDDDLENVKAFCSTANICKERLELFGASYDKAKSDFENAFQLLVEDEIYDFVTNTSITYEFYLGEIKRIINSKEKNLKPNSYKNFTDYLREFDFILEYQSLELALWSLLYVVEPGAKVEYDLTDIIDSGWTSDCPNDLVDTEKIIVFTEGKTDTEFLKDCLKIFFPHLEEFYHFMDFEISRYEANASRLVHSIKSFVGSGIKNRIIAIFDNDSAALNEIRHLDRVKLPSNIKILQYPNIDLATNYPTIGPTGIQRMDVNGLAGSIEMYLGRDCLLESEDFTPIQWTGYIESIKKYQGVILNKDGIQKKFRQKVKDFNPTQIVKEDWKELISIIELMNNAWK